MWPLAGALLFLQVPQQPKAPWRPLGHELWASTAAAVTFSPDSPSHVCQLCHGLCSHVMLGSTVRNRVHLPLLGLSDRRVPVVVTKSHHQDVRAAVWDKHLLLFTGSKNPAQLRLPCRGIGVCSHTLRSPSHSYTAATLRPGAEQHPTFALSLTPQFHPDVSMGSGPTPRTSIFVLTCVKDDDISIPLAEDNRIPPG